jgi:hypothetical protein
MALLTVKDAVSQASLEIGITQRPVTQAVGSVDQDIVQMTALLSAVADEVTEEQPYKGLLGPDGTKKMGPSPDTDQILFDGRLAVAGLKFRFLAAKGLEFGEPLRDFSTRLNKLAGRANKRLLDLYSEIDGGVIQ